MPYFQTKPHGILRHMTPELCSSLIVDCEARTVQTQETAQDISETSISPVVWQSWWIMLTIIFELCHPIVPMFEFVVRWQWQNHADCWGFAGGSARRDAGSCLKFDLRDHWKGWLKSYILVCIYIIYIYIYIHTKGLPVNCCAKSGQQRYTHTCIDIYMYRYDVCVYIYIYFMLQLSIAIPAILLWTAAYQSFDL